MRTTVVDHRATGADVMKTWLWIACLLGSSYTTAGLASSTPHAPSLQGRLFYSPAQRAMLNQARLRQVTISPSMAVSAPEAAPSPPAPISFDGVITRSDGVATHWINGRPHVGRSSEHIRNLKPGQTRSAEKVYEPYQIRQPQPSPESALRPRAKLLPPEDSAL